MEPIAHLAAWFFGGAFLANGVPHFVLGTAGRRFPTPFASPPGRGESPPALNVLWGFANLCVGVVLLRVGEPAGVFSASGVAAASGFLLMALACAWHFGRKDHASPGTPGA